LVERYTIFGGSVNKLELTLMKKYNMVYEDAHELANGKYNYQKELDKFLERIGG